MGSRWRVRTSRRSGVHAEDRGLVRGGGV